VREFRLGKKRIIVPARMIKNVVDPETGTQRRYFDATDETYEALSTDDPDSLRFQDNSVELRVEEHIAAINAFLNIFCLQVGLSFGTFSFDAKGGLKTATEVISENSKTYKTVKNFQNMIRPAVERLVENIIAVAALYDMKTPDGQSVAALRDRGFEVNVAMDDGITQDRQTNINEGVTLVGAGLLSKKSFLTDPKYGQCLTEQDAEKELAQIAKEKKVSGDMLDKINLTLDWALEQVSGEDAYLPETVKRLLSVMEYDVPYTGAQLMQKLRLKSRENFRKLYLVPALERSLIIMSVPDKPTSRNQSYIRK
jgi:A118 family predicted phage portal protein